MHPHTAHSNTCNTRTRVQVKDNAASPLQVVPEDSKPTHTQSQATHSTHNTCKLCKLRAQVKDSAASPLQVVPEDSKPVRVIQPNIIAGASTVQSESAFSLYKLRYYIVLYVCRCVMVWGVCQ